MKLSKLIIASVVALTAAATSFAGEMHFGARLGLGYTSFWNTEVSETITDEDSYYNEKTEMTEELAGLDDASGLAYGFGVAMVYKLSPSFAIQPELMFAHRSRSTSSLSMKTTVITYRRSDSNSPWVLDDTDPDMYPLGVEVTLDQWYIDIPLMFRFSMPTGLFFNAGPIFSIMMSADGEASVLSMDVSDFMTTFVLGAGVGAGYSVSLANGQQLDIDVRFNLGLTSLISDDIDYMGNKIEDATDYANPKDFNIMVGVTYWFM